MTDAVALRTAFNAGFHWLRESVWFARRDAALAWGSGLVVALIAVALSHLPFIGGLVFVLLLPMLLAGALRMLKALEHNEEPVPDMAADDAPRGFAAYPWRVKRAARGLFADWQDEERILPVIIICTLTLAAAVCVQILGVLLKIGGAALPAMLSGSVGPRIWVPALIGLILVIALRFVLFMALVFAIPLIVHRRELPLVAIGKSLRIGARHVGALIVLILPFAVAWLAADALAVALPFPADDLLRLIVVTILFPLFAGAVHRAYRDCLP